MRATLHNRTAFKMPPRLSLRRLSRPIHQTSVLKPRVALSLTRCFSSQGPSLAQPPRSWTPTPFVTETVVWLTEIDGTHILDIIC